MTATRPRLLMFAALAGAGLLATGAAILSGTSAPSPATAPSARPVQSAPAPTLAPTPSPNALTAPAPARAPGTSGAPTLDEVLAADATADVLVAGLHATDAIIAAEAANALVARTAIESVPALIAYDVIAHPKTAPSIIYALGKLGGAAEPDQRDAAVDRLLALMAEEKRRGAPESQGNLLQIYEALGDTGDARAIPPLERELLDTTVPTAPKVVVVQALVALKATGARGTLEQLAAQLAKSAQDTGLEAELRRELLTVVKQALVQLS